MNQEADTPAPAPKQTAKMKILYNTETGETTVQESRPSGATVAPSVEQASARNKAGQPIPLSMAGPNDLIEIPGYGDSIGSVFEGMGLLVRDGNGYKLAGQQQPGEQKPVEDQPAGDPTGVDPTSPQTDQTLSAIESKSPAALEGLVTSLSQTGQVCPAIIADMARTHGVEPVQMQASVDALVADHSRAARQAIARVDSSID